MHASRLERASERSTMRLQPAFQEDTYTISSPSRSSSCSSMSSPYIIDSSPPSSPGFQERMIDSDDEEDDVQKTPGSSREVVKTKNVMWKVHPVRYDQEPEDIPESNQYSPVHPYSASTLSTMTGVMHKSPTLYEKDGRRSIFKRHNPSLTIDEDQQKLKGLISRSQLGSIGLAHRRRQDDDYLRDDLSGSPSTAPSTRRLTVIDSGPLDPDDELWSNAIDEMVDLAGHTIDLSNSNLSKVSTRVSDLENLVVLQGTADSSSHGPMSRTGSVLSRAFSRSASSSVFGADRLGAQAKEIHLFLMNNHITSLPNELFRLETLVTLSLRSNRLTELPPLISQLCNLRELNVANNKLRYLPSEIQKLKLSSLSVEMNPFVENPDPDKYSPITRRYSVMPLSELALRVLISPEEDQTTWIPLRSRVKTVLENQYDLPLEASKLPPNVGATLAACIPGSVTTSLYTSHAPSSPLISNRSSQAPVHSHVLTSPSLPSISICPSRKHLVVNEGYPDQLRTPVFVDHAEERLSWEKEVAGCKVGGEYGVPVLWRGCRAGCLDDLFGEAGISGHDETSGLGEDGDWDMDVDTGFPPVHQMHDSDGEELPAVRAVQQSAFTSEDFEFDD